jgi:hypothetical protein
MIEPPLRIIESSRPFAVWINRRQQPTAMPAFAVDHDSSVFPKIAQYVRFNFVLFVL